MKQSIREQFEDLTYKLSPEHLYCDGEISQSEGNRRYRQIKKEWKFLEKKVGRKVTEEEIEKVLYKQYIKDN